MLRVMLSETKHLALGPSKRHCEILHFVQDDKLRFVNIYIVTK